MASPAHHTGFVKWYNVKAGYGFIEDLRTGKDIFCHASGLTRALKDRPPREGDEVLLAIQEGSKGPEALAGRNHRRLQELVPVILQHNGLPAIQIPLCALDNPARTIRSRSLRGKTGDATDETVAAPNPQQEEAAPAGDEPKNREKTGTETQDDPPSGKQEDNDGWVTKEKRRRRKTYLRLVLPKREQTTTPDIALRESPTITKLRREKQTGKVREDVLHGCYIHEENRFVGNIKGYT
ncbi:Y-box-binding protein 2-like [Portunus trituberculatus]|uniref:Y-box-binding protein 2-like n=1 Tax=Portunus trituberculatus TaxID=210409 RepID=UPI001E1CB5CB|nr:Y-box-binding protein 2-like [Portunus trituberculatus]